VIAYINDYTCTRSQIHSKFSHYLQNQKKTQKTKNYNLIYNLLTFTLRVILIWILIKGFMYQFLIHVVTLEASLIYLLHSRNSIIEFHPGITSATKRKCSLGLICSPCYGGIFNASGLDFQEPLQNGNPTQSLQSSNAIVSGVHPRHHWVGHATPLSLYHCQY
jgi:hypothetical protein